MKKYLFIVLLVGLAFGQDGLFSKFNSKYPKLYCSECDLTMKQTIGGFVCVDGHTRIEKSAFMKDEDGNYYLPSKEIRRSYNSSKEKTLVAGSPTNSFYSGGELRPKWNFDTPKDPFKAGTLTLLTTAGGHFYNEQYRKGVFYLSVPIMFLAGDVINRNNLEKGHEGITGKSIQYVALALHFYSIYDSIISAHLINKEYLKLHSKEVDKDSKD